MFIPETIDLGKSENYNLVIRIKDDEFMFSIAEVAHPENRFISGTGFSQDTLLSNIQRIIFDFNFLTQEFNSVKVVFVTSKYTLVPDKFFSEKERLNLYNSVNFDKAEFVLNCSNKDQSNQTVFVAEKDIYEFLLRSLFNPTFITHTSPLIELFAHEGAETSSRRMYVNYHSDLIDIFCFSGDRLEHCLTYKILNIRSQLYFILKIWEQCTLDQLNDKLYIGGNCPDMVEDVLKTYIENVSHVSKFDTLFFPNLGGKQAPLDLLAL